MKNRMVAVLVIALVLIGAGAGYLIDTAYQRTSPNNSVAPCGDSFNEPLLKGLNLTSQEPNQPIANGAVFLTNSTSMVCVQYTGGVHTEIVPVVRGLVNGSYTQSSNVTVTSVQVNASYVAYSMTFTAATKGVFNIELPFVCYGPEIFLAVGYRFHALNDTILKVPLEQTSCPAATGNGNVAGITNLEVAWVRMVIRPST